MKEYPFKCDHAEHGLVSATEVEKANADNKSCAVNETTQPIKLKELLIFKQVSLHQPLSAKGKSLHHVYV